MFYSCHWKLVFKNNNSSFLFLTYFKTLGEAIDINVVLSTNINWNNFQFLYKLEQGVIPSYNC